MPVDQGVRCMLMRGGTSKGAYFLAEDLPIDASERDELLMRIMGTPDARQIDGIGGAHPLTSKVAVVSRSSRPDADVDYLFLQVFVDQPIVTDQQNCGNLLAGIGPFTIERGLVAAEGSSDTASVRIFMVNTDSLATATFPLEAGLPHYAGDAAIDGVPGTAAAIELDFSGIAGGTCGALLPTGNAVDVIDGVQVTLIDNGMPVVVLRAADVGAAGDETPEQLEGDPDLRSRIESIRLAAGPMMNLGDVAAASVPKVTLVSPPGDSGDLRTRTFIPHRVHEAIGVLGAVSVATAAWLPDSPAASVLRTGADRSRIVCEHPTGVFTAAIDARLQTDGTLDIRRAGIIRTTRKLFDGIVFARQQ
jgi:4-oxalomesaconate tautomerase